MKCRSFCPLVDNKSKVLILGSMPGIKSLEMQQYYAHAQNKFWNLVGLICTNENLKNLDYKDRIEILLDNRIALWDVIKSCKREGSLDSNIEKEVPNEIAELLDKYKNIEVICLNGTKAYSAFKKYFPELIKKYKCYKMPSTSPANARYRLEDLYKEWELIKNFL